MSNLFDKVNELFVQLDSKDPESLNTLEIEFVNLWTAVGALEGGGIEALFSSIGDQKIPPIIRAFNYFEVTDLEKLLNGAHKNYIRSGDGFFNTSDCDQINNQIWDVLNNDMDRILMQVNRKLRIRGSGNIP